MEHEQSRSLGWMTRILSDSRILDALITGLEETDDQLLSRIGTYFAVSLDRTNIDYNTNPLTALRVRSQCQVYDMRQYRIDNGYGPFLRGGAVNWVHLESIVHVIQPYLMGLHSCPPIGLEAMRAYSVTGAANRAAEDWACIEGTWRRVVSWLDYRFVCHILNMV